MYSKAGIGEEFFFSLPTPVFHESQAPSTCPFRWIPLRLGVVIRSNGPMAGPRIGCGRPTLVLLIETWMFESSCELALYYLNTSSKLRALHTQLQYTTLKLKYPVDVNWA